MRKEAKRLYDRGFAIHWIRAKSKAPVESKWTTGPRKNWEELEKTFRPEYNVGVRLGTPSKVAEVVDDILWSEGYLAVIDCDVKSTEQKHAWEMEKKVDEIFGKGLRAATPIVASGRGNGSKHIYILTEEPARPRRVAQSKEFVKVKMPSAGKPSKKEIDSLSQKEIDAGLRIRPAWEVSIMGDGQQVVLPPSIHPDSGKPYKWAREGEIPLVTLPQGSSEEGPAKANVASVTANMKGFPAVDLYLVDISQRVIDMIETGEGVEDRSAALFSASLAMVRAGLTDQEILSVLTDPKNYLGGAGYDHAKTSDRKRAAAWVEKYTLRKARQEADAANQFDDEVKVSDLSTEEIEALHHELTQKPKSSWKNWIERSKPGDEASKPKNTFGNVFLIMTNAVGEHVFKYNEFSGATVYGMNTPWGGEADRGIKDIDLLKMKKWFADWYRFEPNTQLIAEVVFTIAAENKWHPVREYLNALEWDGKERIGSWLKKYLGASAPEPYLSAVSRKILVAMVARVMEPGIKFDQVLILEGGQGVGKSTAVRHLASDAWFSDAHINIKDKDAVLSLQAHWVIELGELSGMRKADVDSLKEFISRTTDKIRVPYGKLPEDFPRQCVFIGTTNNDEFLKDETGNRRYWPVSVGEYDFEGIRRDRDQLFAEARILWELAEPLWLEDKEAAAIAVEEQKKRLETDILTDQLEKFFEGELALEPDERKFPVERFIMHDLFADFGPLAGTKDGQAEQKRAARALRLLGYKKAVHRLDGKNTKVWVKGGSFYN